ncbi:MAG: TIGR01212 family radical SAM protein [Sediminispirochaetaceae bacterium]
MEQNTPDTPQSPFYRYSRYLKEKYGRPVYRISVDAGFTCPHRHPDGSGGCSFCDELGSRAAYQEEIVDGSRIVVRRGQPVDDERLELIRLQIERGRGFLTRRYGAADFILYFQAFTNTFAPVEELKKIYDFALQQAPFRELIVSTRPDCVDGGVAALLSSYQGPGFDVWTELGLQSAHDVTLRRVRRGHTVRQFEQAFQLLRDAGLKITVHLIFGLPGESRGEIMETVDFTAALRPDAVKIHNINVAAGTLLEQEYLAGEYTVPSDVRHLEYVVEALRRLPPSTVIQRVTCDTDESRRSAPLSFMPKSRFYQELDSRMRGLGVRQGDLFGRQ